MTRDAATTCDAPIERRGFTRHRDALAILTAEDESGLAQAMAEMAAASASKLARLEGLIEIRGRMTELQEQIRALDARLGEARAYFGAAGANLALARGLHDRLTAKRGEAAARLRDARRRAHEHLGLAAPAPLPVG